MLSLYRFIRHNATKFIVAGFAISGSLMLLRYLKNGLIHEEIHRLQLINKYRSNTLIEGNETLSKKAASKMLLPLKKIIYSLINLEEMLQQTSALTASEKLSHWEAMKILSFTRLILSIYSYCVLLTLVEINLSTISQKPVQEINFSGENINLSDNSNCLNINVFLFKGIRYLFNLIELSVRKIISPINLKEKLTVGNLFEFIFRIKEDVDRQMQAPSLDDVSKHNQKSQLECKLNLYSHLDRLDFQALSTNHLKVAFKNLKSLLFDHFNCPSKDMGHVLVDEGACANLSPHLPMAKIIPLVSNLTDDIFKPDIANKLINEQ